MAHQVTLLPGDGIGPEVTAATLRVLEATGVEFEWDTHEIIGTSAVDDGRPELPDDVPASIRERKVALKGPITTPVGEGFTSVNVQLRQRLDLYANVRPCVSLPGIDAPFDDIDLIIFRENTEGLYAGIETYDPRLEIADSTARVTRRGSERIVDFCFDFAQKNRRETVTLAHKANILKESSGLFLDVGRQVAERYPNVNFNDRIIDNMCMQLVMYPQEYDCIVSTNLFGDILSDLAAGLVGGLGVTAGANFGDDYAVFEAVHGSAPDIAGQGKANPTALIRSAVMMLDHLDEKKAAQAVNTALRDVYAEGDMLTADVGGSSSTSEFAEHLAARVEEEMAA